MSQIKLLLLATNSRGAPLTPIAGLSAIDFFWSSVSPVLRLQPLQDRVYIVANEQSHAALTAWAISSGLTASNVLNNGRSDTSVHVSADIAFAIGEAKLNDSHLVIASLDVLFQPGFNLQRIVEHSILRGKDTVVFHRPPPGADLSQYALLDLDDMTLGATNPRVMSTEPSPRGGYPSDGITSAALAPLVVFRRTSLADLFPPQSREPSVSGPTHASSQTKQMAQIIQEQLIEAGRPVYAFEEDFCLDISTAQGTEGAGVLVSELERATRAQSGDEGGIGPAAQALMEVTETARSLNVIPLGDPGIEYLLGSSSLPKKTFLRFHASGWASSAAANGSPASSSPSATASISHATGTIPLRFADPNTRRHNPRGQHPVYQTSNNQYGLKKPSIVDMPDTYSSSSQHFTNTFYGGPSKVSCMTTAVTKSNVHNALDDF